jgi:hypothetical protein
MSYSIEWEQFGAVAYFANDVSFSDIVEAERELALRGSRSPLRFVISVFTDSNELIFSEAEYRQLNQLRYGGYAAKQSIKFAVVTRCEVMKDKFISNHEKFGIHGEGAAFLSFVDAVDWVHS